MRAPLRKAAAGVNTMAWPLAVSCAVPPTRTPFWATWMPPLTVVVSSGALTKSVMVVVVATRTAPVTGRWTVTTGRVAGYCGPVVKLLVKSQARLILLDAQDMIFASIEDGVITVATSGANGMEGQSNCRTLEELLESLDPNLFWRAHRSYLVNINRIKEVVPWFKSSYQLRMDDKKQTEIPVSRAQTKRLRELFGL